MEARNVPLRPNASRSLYATQDVIAPRAYDGLGTALRGSYAAATRDLPPEFTRLLDNLR